jgi:hypothetical protein
MLNRLKTQPTVFLILAPLIIVISVFQFFRVIGLPGGESMYGFLYLFLIFFSALALVIDYALITFTNYKIALITEATFVILLVVLYLTHNHN